MNIDKLKELINQGYSSYKIAEELKLSQTGIWYWLRKLKLKTNYSLMVKLPPNKCLCGKFTYNKKQCSNKCSSDARIKATTLKIENGEPVVISLIRKYIINRDGWICSICNNTKWQDKLIPLVLDHIDGNSNNNNLKNLRLLCCNCDAQTPTYKSKNNGNGRYKRMKRYYENKSYQVILL